MGNCYGKSTNREVKGISNQLGGERKVLINVKMTVGEFKELLAREDLKRGDTDLGLIIVRECMAGKLSGRIVALDDDQRDLLNERSLYIIAEEDDCHDQLNPTLPTGLPSLWSP